MSKLATCESPASASLDDNTLFHIFCECDEDLGLCGLDISDYAISDPLDGDPVCVVCLDLEFVPCPRCGR